jgi:hypothetical protein
MLCAIAAAMVCNAPARAGDALDRVVSFHISASPLASALIEFSSQSGIQVAAADAVVSHVNSGGVAGALSGRAAMKSLLRGTGLVYTQVGEATIAIRPVSVGSALGALPRRAAPPASEAAGPDRDADETSTPDIPEVTVTAPKPPTDQELAGDSLYEFVVHHATVHYVYGAVGNLAHWRGGKQSICPRTLGLDPASNSFVTARIRAVAAYVGAPLQSDPQCRDDVRVIFTPDPAAAMKEVADWASGYFRGDRWYTASRRLLEFVGDKPIQGWYLTTPRASRVSNTDIGLLRIYLEPLWPRIVPHWLGNDGQLSGIGTVILVVDTTKAAGYSLGTVADYAAMVTLSLVQSPDHCDPLPSILDLTSSSCAREKPTALTAGDLAFLKALYYRNYVYGSSPSRADIEYSMTQQFKGR